MNTQSKIGVELAAELADRGEHVVVIAPGGAACPPDWRYAARPTTSQQLRLWMRSWPNAQIRVVRDGQLVDPLATPKPKKFEPAEIEPAEIEIEAEIEPAEIESMLPAPAEPVDETVLVRASTLQHLRAERDRLAAQAGEPVIAAIPTIVACPIPVPIVIETKVLDMEVIDGLRDIMLNALGALREEHAAELAMTTTMPAFVPEAAPALDLAGMTPDALKELLRAAMIEEARRDSEAQ